MALLVLLSVMVMMWSALYNTVFDVIEQWRTARVASARHERWRSLHAVGHEASTVLLTWPIIVVATDLGWVEALLADLALALVYVAYAYAFHRAYDAWRPVAAAARRVVGGRASSE
jgi:uncharacterized membrane protein